MENASKALIIAGAILLSIAIIGVGMYVFQNVQETIKDGADMSADQLEHITKSLLCMMDVKVVHKSEVYLM